MTLWLGWLHAPDESLALKFGLGNWCSSFHQLIVRLSAWMAIAGFCAAGGGTIAGASHGSCGAYGLEA